MVNVAVVTGASKGLGFETANLFCSHGLDVIGLSRSRNEAMRKLNAKYGRSFHYLSLDLTHESAVERAMIDVCTEIIGRVPGKVYVVNNAGTVEPIERLGHLDNQAIRKSVHLNVLAPLLINNMLLKQLAHRAMDVSIMNVTSGAAERPIYGWSIYGATKAAINLHTKAAGLEQNQINSRHCMAAFSLGIMNTDMQGTIRQSSPDAFAEIETFKSFKSEDKLRQPGEVAHALVNLMLNGQVENGCIYDVDDLIP
ncbi:SDR family NAD(P)-dependent oxidoreductase [Sporolactobacillus shoreicorticis]|uniref:SDR family NAD(P)-dependent oxidoreductase n=1 Tax=Sporolactobacillus shoreicorticis TaxID=1923877 RepID=A0ABW5S3Z1_9BACL|nr:SDR family NAD(P)-dependent oxidoreductase [Sporolactobacillus shoreicorticis]MCO7127694.1 SDR family NAD(P)-dependent oxidoreductase [Sporolactobacillus shoreicorticis]